MEMFSGKVVYLDTAPLIYFIEAHSKYQSVLAPIFQANLEGQFQFITSTLTLTEVISGPLKAGRPDLADLIVSRLNNSEYIRLIDFDLSIAIETASVKSKWNLKTPDAIHLATAIIHEASYIFTNDRDFNRNDLIPVLVVDDLI